MTVLSPIPTPSISPRSHAPRGNASADAPRRPNRRLLGRRASGEAFPRGAWERGGFLFALLLFAALPSPLRAQNEPDLRPRPGAPKVEDFEKDEDGDGVPDGWYNLRDARLVKGGTSPGVTCLRFENDKPGRPARISRAFGFDGQKFEAVIIGLWVRQDGVIAGPKLGEEPGLMIDFLQEERLTLRRGSLGPWTPKTIGTQWTHVARRLPVPPGVRDAILSVGLLGATGALEVDGLTIEPVPAGEVEATNLVRNGDLELGDPAPAGWMVQGGAHRAFPGHRSTSCLQLTRAGAKGMIGLGILLNRNVGDLLVTISAQGKDLRGAGGAEAVVYFLDAQGEPLPGAAGSATAFRWSGSFGWRSERAPIRVPPEAAQAVLQVEKIDQVGVLRVDDVSITTFPDPGLGSWEPWHVEDDTAGWLPYPAAPAIEPGSALDASALLDAPAGKHGRVVVRDGHLAFEKGGRARFFGVQLLPPTAFQDPARTDALVDRLTRSGVNLVRLGDLDVPLGPGRSLFDDTRDDTKALDPEALARLDHLIAGLKKRGTYVAIELMSARRFRPGDDVPAAGKLPPGGGPAGAFDPRIRARAVEAAEALLNHVNPETGLALREDPVLAWLTLAGELSPFDFHEDPNALAPDLDPELKLPPRKGGLVARLAWKKAEADQWQAEAEALRKLKVKAPIAGDSHWRREPEFVAAQAAPGLDLIDDRLFWLPPTWGDPARRSMLWDPAGGLVAEAARKRRSDRPYAVGQWCAHTGGAWALPFEGADLLMAAQSARAEDWDALVRRGVFLFPEVWGSAATGTGGVEDLFLLPEAIGGNPQVFALLPHAASLYLKNGDARHTPAARRRTSGPGRAAATGCLVVDTPHTQALAGWPGGQEAETESLVIEADAPYAVIAATSLDTESIAKSRRLLVTAVARLQPTGFRWADHRRSDVADPGRPPLLQEPLRGRLLWKRTGKVSAYALDNAGHRAAPARLARTADGVRLEFDGRTATMHWELVIE